MDALSSSRLVLRAISPDDRREVVAMFEAGSGIPRWSPPLRPGESFDAMFDRWLGEEPERHARLVAERPHEDVPKLAALVTLSEIVRGVFQNAYIGWRTHPALLRQGYGAEAVELSLRHAFADDGLRLHRVQAAILPDNTASVRVAEKCGFRLEGLARRYLHIREEWRDHLIFAATADADRCLLRSPEVAAFWNRFVQSGTLAGQPNEMPDAFQFGDSPELADRLAALVLSGRKTATCEAFQTYRATGTRPPTVGSLSIVLDGKGRPVTVIETIEVALRPFDEVDARFVSDEGEGDRTLAHWRASHQRYFERTLPRFAAEFDSRMVLVCERFRLRWR